MDWTRLDSSQGCKENAFLKVQRSRRCVNKTDAQFFFTAEVIYYDSTLTFTSVSERSHSKGEKVEETNAKVRLTVIDRAKQTNVKRLMCDLVTVVPQFANLLLGLF